MFLLERLISPRRRGLRENDYPSRGVFSEHVVTEGSRRRLSRIVDIRSTPKGDRLSDDFVYLLVLALEPDWLLFPSREELNARSQTH
jgi:hypothetical protein